MIFDHFYTDKQNKKEHIWIIRSSRDSLSLPHQVESVGYGTWAEKAWSERPIGHRYIGFEWILSGSQLLVADSKEYLVGSNTAYVLLPEKPHRYISLEPLEKRFISLSGPLAVDLLHHFELTNPKPFPLAFDSKKLKDQPLEILFQKAITLVASAKNQEPTPNLSKELAHIWYSILIEVKSQKMYQGSEYSNLHPAIVKAREFLPYALKKSISRSELAEYCAVSESHLARIFQKELGISPMSWMQKQKMEWAGTLLTNSRLRVSDVAAQVGFDDPLYFSHCFRRYMGTSPKEYRSIRGGIF